ncbi:chromate efflux transporter [Catenovulum sp. 2E275]|uniref:chromate efflux transporter n=1 Tax=Catenovulum sp. 2E275 TaxID=2980497 RepID=UPI0021D0AC93|nr:chromate efflux transporter [Catenovulum sp. 2E275]MCU4677621.1 chromate efflux transporter [Catenovulum sp. 2E275]
MKPQLKQFLDLFLCFLKLGCTAFGGPVAHLACFRTEFVEKQKVFTDSQFTTLISICQFLPGPASSQVGLAIGLKQAGQLGAFIAWFAFTMPSAILLILFALSLNTLDNQVLFNLAQGLKLAVVAVIIHALWQMAKSFCTDKISIAIMLLSTMIMAIFAAIWLQFLVIILAALIGILCFKSRTQTKQNQLDLPIKSANAKISLTLLLAGLIVLPLLAGIFQNQFLALFDSFFRIGATVFGGGHVVLPMLKNEVVAAGWVSEQNFLAGYGATQAVPGPIFTFSAFLGAANALNISPVLAGLVCLFAIFLPSFLLVNGCFYYWQFVQNNQTLKNAITGVNAAVVGLLLSYLVNPIAFDLFEAPQQLAIVFGLTLLVFSQKIPVWVIVILTGVISALVNQFFSQLFS